MKHKLQERHIKFTIQEHNNAIRTSIDQDGYANTREDLAKMLRDASFSLVTLVQKYKMPKEDFIANINALWDGMESNDKKEGNK